MGEMRFERVKTAKKPEKILDNEDKETLKYLEKSIADLVSKLREQIDRAEYQLILGEDTSGRLPTVMLATVLKDIYESCGRTGPMVRYLTPSRPTKETHDIWEARTTALKEALSRVKRTFDSSGRSGKVLVVTDTIHTGNTMEGYLDAIKQAGMMPDVATISLLKETGNAASKRADAFKKAWGVNVVWSQDTLHYVFRNPLTGVRKSKDDTYAVPNEHSTDVVRAGRELAIRAAHRIAAKYLESSGRSAT